MHLQPDLGEVTIETPPSRGGLPAEVPHAHPLQAQTANMVFVEGAEGAVVEDAISVQEYPDRRDEIAASSGLAGRYLAASYHLPGGIGAREDDAQLLHCGIAIGYDKQLRPIDAK